MNKNMTEQKTSSPNPSPLPSSSPTTSKYPLIPNHHHPPNDHGPHRCNRLSLDATCRTPSTLESLSAFFGVMQPDNLMARHHFQKSVSLFEARATRKSVGPSRSKRLMNPERTGHGGQPESQPSTVEN